MRSPEVAATVDAGLERLNRCIANKFMAEVDKADGPTADAACNPKTNLVEAKLEMVRATGVFHCGVTFSRLYWINTPDRL